MQVSIENKHLPDFLQVFLGFYSEVYRNSIKVLDLVVTIDSSTEHTSRFWMGNRTH